MKAGQIQKLKVSRISDFGVYLADDEQNEVLLPNRYVSLSDKVGDEKEVFIYHDSEDRLVATTETPKIKAGEISFLKVVDKSIHGAFLDWGLPKDLLLPFREQTKKVEKGDQILAALYVDKSGRLCATMKLYDRLRQDSPYKKDDVVRGTIYETSGNFGVFVAVDDCYSALIPKREAYGDLKVGQEIEARVSRVHEDGKLDLSVRKKAFLQMDDDAQRILEKMEELGGALPFTDKAAPEQIKEELGLSKNAFKRAVGRLLKEQKIQITEKAIEFLEK